MVLVSSQVLVCRAHAVNARRSARAATSCCRSSFPTTRLRGAAARSTRGAATIVKEAYTDGLEAFPGLRALFERGREAGLRIALASSAKGEELGIYKRKADIEGLVEEQTSSDDVERSKPHGDIFQAALDRLSDVAPREAVVVGDTPYDAQAAK